MILKQYCQVSTPILVLVKEKTTGIREEITTKVSLLIPPFFANKVQERMPPNGLFIDGQIL